MKDCFTKVQLNDYERAEFYDFASLTQIKRFQGRCNLYRIPWTRVGHWSFLLDLIQPNQQTYWLNPVQSTGRWVCSDPHPIKMSYPPAAKILLLAVQKSFHHFNWCVHTVNDMNNVVKKAVVI